MSTDQGATGDALFAGRRILVVSPHPDDETYGCGGTIARARAAAAEVCVVVVSTPKALAHFNRAHPLVDGRTREAELGEAMAVLGVDRYDVLYPESELHMRLDTLPLIDLVGRLERTGQLSLENVRPDILLMPARSTNQDHDVVFRACMAAVRPRLRGDKAFVPAVLAYEQPHLAWRDEAFEANVHVDIGGHLSTKLAACACYRSQVREGPDLGSLASVERLARLRGAAIAVDAAESFRAYRLAV